MYIYQADVYCDHCGRDLCSELTIPGDAVLGWRGGIAILDERSYDSDDYPKGPYPESQCETDHLEFCAGCGEHIDTSLTPEGIDDTLAVIAGGCSEEYETIARDVLRAHGVVAVTLLVREIETNDPEGWGIQIHRDYGDAIRWHVAIETGQASPNDPNFVADLRAHNCTYEEDRVWILETLESIAADLEAES